jgi:Glutaredoxin-like domain (DUF836)
MHEGSKLCRRDDAVLRRVTLYVAPGCHLCERALEIVQEVRQDIPFGLDVVDIAGDASLEETYRPWLPVLEIDGERAFTYVIVPDVLRARLA